MRGRFTGKRGHVCEFHVCWCVPTCLHVCMYVTSLTVNAHLSLCAQVYHYLYELPLSTSMCLCDAGLHPHILFEPLATVPERDGDLCEGDCEWTHSQMQSHTQVPGTP